MPQFHWQLSVLLEPFLRLYHSPNQSDTHQPLWGKLKTEVSLYRSGWPTKMTPRAHWWLVQVTKEPSATSNALAHAAGQWSKTASQKINKYCKGFEAAWSKSRLTSDWFALAWPNRSFAWWKTIQCGWLQQFWNDHFKMVFCIYSGYFCLISNICLMI